MKNPEKPSRQPAVAASAPDSLADSLAAQLEIERARNAELMEALAVERDRAARAEAEAKAQLAEANARVAELAGKLASLAERQQAIAPDSLADSLAAQLEIERARNAELMEALAVERDRAARAEAEAKAQLAEANARVAELAGKLASLAERQQAIAATPWWRRGRMAMKLLGPGGE